VKIVSKKKLWIWLVGLLGVLVIGLAGTLMMVSASVRPENVVNKFEQAVLKRDVEGVLRLLTTSDPVLKLSKDHASTLIEFFDDEDRVFEDEMDDLRDEWNGVRMRRSPTDILSLVEDGKKLGMFTEHKIAVQPFYFKIRTNQKDAVIRLDDTQILTAKSNNYTKIIGPLMPGEYDVEASFDGEYVKALSTRETVELPKQHDDEIDLSIEADYIYPYSTYHDAVLYVNGESTELTIGEIDRFGPVALDGSMTLSARMVTDWGEFESEPVTVTEDNLWPELYFDVYEVTVDGTFPQARVYVNGEDTGLTIEDTAYYSPLGPFAGDETITLSAVHDSPWGELKSSETTVNVSDLYGYAYLSFDGVPEAARQGMMQGAHEFWPSAFDSILNYDPELLRNVSESSRYDIYYQLPSLDYYETSFELLDVTYAYDYAYMWYSEGDYYMYTDVKLHYIENLYDSWSETVYPYEVNSWYTLTMQYDEEEDTWRVSGLYPTYEGASYTDTVTDHYSLSNLSEAEV
jgi:uncharacterized membrane protein YvbJ